MNKLKVVLTAAALLAPFSMADAQAGRSVSFHSVTIGDAVILTGQGTVNPSSGLQRVGGGFRAIKDITGGPLAGLRAGEGVRWEAAEVLSSSGFKCSAADPLKTAFTDDDTIVMKVLFFRQGDGNTPSFTANVFVSAVDENPDEPGVQNAWIQGVGCGEADVSFR